MRTIAEAEAMYRDATVLLACVAAAAAAVVIVGGLGVEFEVQLWSWLKSPSSVHSGNTTEAKTWKKK